MSSGAVRLNLATSQLCKASSAAGIIKIKIILSSDMKYYSERPDHDSRHIQIRNVGNGIKCEMTLK